MNQEVLVYRFSCQGCGAPVAVQKNKENTYECPFCENQHHISADDSDAEMENLSYKELHGLQMDMAKAQVRGVRMADMQAVMEASVIQQKLMKLMMRYDGKDADEIAEIDKNLKEQRAEQQKRLAEAEAIGDHLIYSYNCANCGSPINHKPKNEYEEILCPTCGGRVSFEMNKAEAKDRTKAAASQEDKAKRMEKLGEQIREARAAGDIDRANELDAEYQELALSYSQNFDYSQHQHIYDDIAKTHGASMMTAEMQLGNWQEKKEKLEEYDAIQAEIEPQIEAIEEKMDEISEQYEDDEDPELLEKLKPYQVQIDALNKKLDDKQAELDQLDQEFDDAKYSPLDGKGKIREIMFEISRLDPEDYSEIEEYEEDKQKLEEKKQGFIAEAGLAADELSMLIADVEKEIEQKKIADAEYEAQSSADDAGLIEAANANDFETFKKLLHAPDTNASVYATAKDGEWAINIFTRHGNWEAVEHMLKVIAGPGSIDPDQRDHDEKGRTILFTALEEGHTDIANKLIDLGADCSYSDDKSNTPLHNVTEKGDIEMVKLMLTKDVDCDYTNDDGFTPFHIAAKSDNLEIVKLMLEKGADYDYTDDQSNTALHYAAKNGNLEMVKVLVEAGADKDYTNDVSDTPLHLAVKSGNAEIVKYLIEEDADVELENDDSLTPKALAEQLGKGDIARLF